MNLRDLRSHFQGFEHGVGGHNLTYFIWIALDVETRLYRDKGRPVWSFGSNQGNDGGKSHRMVTVVMVYWVW